MLFEALGGEQRSRPLCPVRVDPGVLTVHHHDDVSNAHDDNDTPRSPSSAPIGLPGADAAAYDARFRTLIEAAPDGIVISRDGRILYLNPAAVRLLGYERSAELEGVSMGVFLDPADMMAMRQRVETMRSTGQTLSPREYRARKRDGSLITAEITSIPIEFEGGTAVLAFARDVTERARMQEQLGRSDRLAALGTLAAGVAHEINNPLAAISLGVGALDRLSQRVVPSSADRARVAAMLQELERGVERVADIVKGLRAFSRGDEEQRGPVDLEVVVEAANKLVAHEIRFRANIVVRLSASRWVLGNATRLEQVFVNLFLNATHALDPKRTGRIEVESRLTKDGRVTIDISDNGAGIGKEVIGRVFDPFFTTKPVGMGTGLGLSVCHRIVTELGGEIAIESEPGRGTVVHLVLPAAHPPSSPSTTTQRRESRAPRRRILVIDDEPSVREILVQLLCEEHDVVAAESGEVALTSLRGDHTFDLVLCDLTMPGMGGVELFEVLEAQHPEEARKVVFMTGGAFTPRAAEFLERQTRPHLEKPFSVSQLDAVVRGKLPVD